MKLAVHDLLSVKDKDSSLNTYNNTKELVKKLDKLGYHRYWFSEHHGMEQHASTVPELLIANLAGVTENIRLGTGGTMIMHYSPLRVAEMFKTLSALAGDRVDLGLGRAPGGDYHAILALVEGKYTEQDLYLKMEEILAFLKDESPKGELYQKIKAVPTHPGSLAEPWMLGSTGNSARRGAHMGLGYSFAKFFSIETPPEVFKMYKEEFKPSVFFEKPVVSVSYKILVADNKDELEYLSKPFEMTHVASRKGLQLPILNPEEVRDHKFSDFDKKQLEYDYKKNFIVKGTKEEVEEILCKEIETYCIDELMFYTPLYDQEKRYNSYKLLHEIFDGK